jgi:multidrug efflux pump subunit AcrA (membrane-fusion protein)
LQPGTYVEVHFKLPNNANVMRLPTSALLFREDGLRVATVGPDNKVFLKPVTIGRDLGTEVEIASGLTATDKIIDSPSDSIAEGDVVQPEQAQKVAEAQP